MPTPALALCPAARVQSSNPVSLDPGLKQRLDRIRPALSALRAFDPACEVFGARTHRYDLAPPVSAEAISAFERDHGIVLPLEYRAFLAHVGGAGAGPAYGLSTLLPRHDTFEPFSPDDDALVDAGADDDPTSDPGPLWPQRRPPDPARPFVLRGPHPPRPGVWRPQQREPLPADVDPLDGALHLAELGCSYCSFLVLNGVHAGEVWNDGRVDEDISRIGPTGLGFLGWYEEWLARAAQEAAYNAALDAVLDLEPAVDPRIVEQIPQFDAESARYPECAPGHARRGIVLVHARRFAEADAAFARALELDADRPYTQIGLAAGKAARGDLEGALALLAALDQDVFLSGIHAITLRTSILRAAGRTAEARAAEEHLLRRTGKRPFYPIACAFRLARAEDLEGAEAALRAAEERLREHGLGGVDEWLRRLAAQCRVKGRADLAGWFEARAAAAGAEPGASDADRSGWPDGPIERSFFP